MEAGGTGATTWNWARQGRGRVAVRFAHDEARLQGDREGGCNSRGKGGGGTHTAAPHALPRIAHTPQHTRTFLRWPCLSYDTAALVVISLTALASLPPTPLSALLSALPRASDALTCAGEVGGGVGEGWCSSWRGRGTIQPRRRACQLPSEVFGGSPHPAQPSPAPPNTALPPTPGPGRCPPRSAQSPARGRR